MDDHIYEVHFNHLQSTVNDIRNDIMKTDSLSFAHIHHGTDKEGNVVFAVDDHIYEGTVKVDSFNAFLRLVVAIRFKIHYGDCRGFRTQLANGDRGLM